MTQKRSWDDGRCPTNGFVRNFGPLRTTKDGLHCRCQVLRPHTRTRMTGGQCRPTPGTMVRARGWPERLDFKLMSNWRRSACWFWAFLRLPSGGSNRSDPATVMLQGIDVTPDATAERGRSLDDRG